MRPTRILLLWAAISAGAVGLAIATADPGPTRPPAVPPTNERQQEPRRNDSPSVIQTDLWMTQAMGIPTAGGPMFTGGVVDQQLQHSRDAGFVAELEQAQRDIDRMLGRGTP